MCSYIDQRPLWEYLQTNKRLLSQWKWSSVCLDLCVLSSLTTQSSATSCIRRQTSVPTLFQSHNFVETKVIHLHIDPQIMYFILSCFLFMFLHIYDMIYLFKVHSVLGEHRLHKLSVLLHYDPNQETSCNDVMLQSVITQQCYCRQRRLLLVSDRGGLWCTCCDFNTHSATVCFSTQAVDSQTNFMMVFKL